MLKSIDVLIGLSVVMLVASMAVTVMIGFVTYILNTRGRNLKQGISDLLCLINPEFTKQAAGKIAEAVLTHPLIRDGEKRMGTVVHRDELTKLLMELAAGVGPTKLDPDTQASLLKTLQDHGIADPAETLSHIRTASLKLEKSSPELSNMARSNLAILNEAETHFVAKINTWFDQTMDRVSQRFTLNTRTITFICGLLLAIALQLDSIAIVNRISMDDALRNSLVDQAKTQANNAAGLYEFLSNDGMITIPQYPGDFAKFTDLRHLTGILFTTLLLSLGAPFWYGALQQLLQLRSKVAQEDDDQRKSRQTSQELVKTPVGPSTRAPET